MGITRNEAKLLLKAKQLGVDFTSVITIGRQALYLQEDEIQLLIKENGLSAPTDESITKERYAEPFLKVLGAQKIDSLDASTYEKATVIHDLNVPLPVELQNHKYSLVIDGGSLEHVFNFPTAIKSCMQMVAKNGFYISITPANNLFGHGFYQFNPELYYRIFSESNGFKVIKMYAYTLAKNTNVYEVLDPQQVRRRIELVNAFPIYLFVIAQKTEEKEIFATIPQQSDYELIAWEKKQYGTPEFPKKKTNKNIIKKLLPSSFKLAILRKMVILRKHTALMGTGNPLFIRKTDI